jgi:hypothetical protein
MYFDFFKTAAKIVSILILKNPFFYEMILIAKLLAFG